MCEKLGCLPSAGGLLDQEYLHVKYLEAVWKADAKIQEEEDEKREAKSGSKR